MKFPSSLRPGILVALVAISIYAIPIRWIETRRLTPFDMPISVSNGHFQTGDFRINFDAVYVFNFERPEDASPDYLNCSGQARSAANITVLKNGRPVPLTVSSTSNDYSWRRIDSFRAAPGTYSIDVEVLPGAECLNNTRMQLVVDAYDVNFGAAVNLLWCLCVFLGGVGIVLLIRSDPVSFHHQTAVQHQDLPLISQSTGYSLIFRLQKRRPMPLFHHPPDFALIFIATMVALLVVCLFVWMNEAYPVGTYVLILAPHEIRAGFHSRTEPLHVCLPPAANSS